jgi:hypothetical protein
MALQTSGAISISEIKTELGSSSNSLRTLSDAAGFITPDSMSEFYGYSNAPTFTPSTQYWQGDGVNDTLRLDSAPIPWDTTTPLTWSGWYRIESGGGAVEQLGSISTEPSNGSNQVFLQFDGRNNRIYHRVRNNGTFCQRQYPLHENLAVTGVSSAGWKATNMGNTNADGFVHLVFTYNPSDTTSNAMQVYWNGQQLTSSVNNSGGTRSAPWAAGSMAVADIVSSTPFNPNVFQGSVDNVAMWARVLTQSEITTMYNGGVPVQYDEAGVVNDILAEYRFEGGFTDATGTLPELENLNGGILQPY